MVKIYMDESGYTGEDLCSPEQPVFVLASTDFSKDEVLEILSPIYDSYPQAKELKHVAISKHSKGQRKIAEMIKRMQPFSNKIKVFIIHKQFALLQKFVDLWLEPIMYRDGLNFYEKGMNMAFCKMMFHCLRGFEGKAFLDSILREYQTFMDNPSEKTYEKFWRKIYKKAESLKEEKSSELMDFLLLIPRNLDFSHVYELGKKPHDIAMTSAVQIASSWREDYEEIQVIHDKSSNMSNEIWMWDAITSPDIAETYIGFGDYRSMKLPLNVTNTTFEDSEIFPQIQLCDLIAGAMATFFQSKNNENYKRSDYAKLLFDAEIFNFHMSGIWPDYDIEPTQELNSRDKTYDPLDTFGSILKNAKS